MTFADAIDSAVARTGHDRLRWLASDANPDVQQRDGYRRTALILLGQDQVADPAPKPPAYPPLARQALNSAKAAGRVVKAIAKREPVQVSGEEQARRLAICHACEHYDSSQDRCRKCGCRVNWKARLATEHCPINLW